MSERGRSDCSTNVRGVSVQHLIVVKQTPRIIRVSNNKDRLNIHSTLNAAYILGVCWFVAFLLLMLLTGPGCGALSSVTPADRAAGYAAHAKGHTYACKAYAFDLQQGLVEDVPEMARVCE